MSYKDIYPIRWDSDNRTFVSTLSYEPLRKDSSRGSCNDKDGFSWMSDHNGMEMHILVLNMRIKDRGCVHRFS